MLVVILMCVSALTGCTTTDKPPYTPPLGGNGTIQAADENSVLAGFPLYPGATRLSNPVDFDWKNIKTAYAVPNSYWEYYLIPAAYLDAAGFYRFESLRPPFANSEIYWKETDKGILGAYYQKDAKEVYSRIWFIPHPNNTQESYLIIMRNNDIGGCSIF